MTVVTEALEEWRCFQGRNLLKEFADVRTGMGPPGSQAPFMVIKFKSSSLQDRKYESVSQIFSCNSSSSFP